mmetsp:Transcript_5702/g.14634  ORF Transcript_5702/g.14634 Transcript_5702/m.14634 type:complete len:314 (+) Transcript_5702:319-1260(+)
MRRHRGLRRRVARRRARHARFRALGPPERRALRHLNCQRIHGNRHDRPLRRQRRVVRDGGACIVCMGAGGARRDGGQPTAGAHSASDPAGGDHRHCGSRAPLRHEPPGGLGGAGGGRRRAAARQLAGGARGATGARARPLLRGLRRRLWGPGARAHVLCAGGASGPGVCAHHGPGCAADGAAADGRAPVCGRQRALPGPRGRRPAGPHRRHHLEHRQQREHPGCKRPLRWARARVPHHAVRAGCGGAVGGAALPGDPGPRAGALLALHHCAHLRRVAADAVQDCVRPTQLRGKNALAAFVTSGASPSPRARVW